MVRTELAKKVVAEISRLLIGVVFIFSGIVKAVDPVGGAIKIGDYLMAFGFTWLSSFDLLLTFCLSAAEFTLGVCMLLGVYRRYSSFFVLVFMLFMTPLTLYLALFNPVSDCGCFGDAIVLTNWETFLKNIVLLAAAVVAFIYNRYLCNFYTFKAYWFVTLFAYLSCIGFNYSNYSHLPIIDFRPFKVGANIPALVSIPDNAPVDEYAYYFTYEKNGVKKEFSLENYPADDSTWTYVSSRSDLIKKGYVPPVPGFVLYDSTSVDITDEVLRIKGPMFWLVIPSIEKADDKNIDAINNVFDFAQEHGYPFYCLTGSSRESMIDWENNTGSEYSFITTDDVLLKTMIRANPGLILINDGVIRAKWNPNDLPDEDYIKEPMQNHLDGKSVNPKEDDGILFMLLSFTVPLLLVWIYDYFRNRRKRSDKQIEN
ncbi:MAG: BT_3928 family protein [Macellibacteroides fermentans]|uniref:BT_3928 family protein n=1 Tax=Macellibacteroides fermentans TaxID=879969 RepID=UPI003AC9F7BC